MILQNMVKCLKCGDMPFSKSRHDFVSCKCGSIAVDGGMEYLKRTGNLRQYQEMSYTLPRKVVQDCVDAVKWARENKRNDLGTFLAVVRALKAHDRIKVDGAYITDE